MAENSRSEDLPDFQAWRDAGRFVVSCFCAAPSKKKNGKTHHYWNVVESKRLDDGRRGGRSGMYCISARSVPRRRRRGARRSKYSMRTPAAVQLRLSEMRLHRPRQWSACWLAGQLWQELQPHRFWAARLPPSRKKTRWDQILQVLATYRLIAPGSEWRLHRQWFGVSTMADRLGADFGLAEEHKLCACHDLLLAHKEALFWHLVGRWRDLFNADFDVLRPWRKNRTGRTPVRRRCSRCLNSITSVT